MDSETTTSLVPPFLSFLALVLVAIIGAWSAIKTSSAEKRQTSETTVDKTLETELVLLRGTVVIKDDHIEFLEEQRDTALRERDEARAEAQRFKLANDEFRAEEKEKLDGRNA